MTPSPRTVSACLCTAAVLWLATACGTSIQIQPSDEPADQSSQDGIDPNKPNTERSTIAVAFDGVRTIRIEIPTGRVSVSQADGGEASLKVTETILIEGLGNDLLADLLNRSTLTAERSFVDDARLDIEAALAEGLADADVAFDVRLVVPADANVEVLLGNGPVEVTDLVGNVEIRTANGPISISHVTGNVVAQTTNRPIGIQDVTGNVRAETTEAEVTLRLTPADDGLVSATTTQGAIRITVASTTQADLSLSAPDGIITANLAGFAVSNLTTGKGFLNGVLNGGGGQIEASADQGEIEFNGT